ncbi:hypothetical protein [Terriglobus roseus]|nr:hypothetical protein [Terriglobus roseus]
MVRVSTVAAALLFSLPVCCSAATEHESPVLIAAADSVPSLPINQPDARPLSSGVIALPEEPAGQLPGAPLSLYLFRLRGSVETAPPALNEPIEQMEAPRFDDQSMLHRIQASPLAPVSRHIRADKFNTNDAVASDFAICYRLNRRSSLQVIPGDPAPVKLPITSMANNMGVTVGMVLRLSRSH